MQMAQNNIGSLVVLKPGEQQLIAGIITERGLHSNNNTVACLYVSKYSDMNCADEIDVY